MGLTAIASSTSAGAGVSSTSAGVSSAISMFTSVGTGPGGIFVAAALVVLLAYLDIFDASDRQDGDVRPLLLASVASLGVTFAALVLYNSLQVLG